MMKLSGVKVKTAKMLVSAACVSTALLLQACSYQEALRGKHEDTVNGHQITVIKPCGLFTENMTRVESLPGRAKYEYTCGQTHVEMVLAEELTVNNKSYGRLNDGDAVVFDHGKVLINSREAEEVAAR